MSLKIYIYNYENVMLNSYDNEKYTILVKTQAENNNRLKNDRLK